MSRHRFVSILAQLGVLLAGLFVGAPRHVGAQEETCFAETNQCVADPFLSYWRDHGGLAINGFPITGRIEQQLEDGKRYTVQYFERVRMEWHPENQPPYDVLLGAFGRLLYLTNPAQPLANAAPRQPGAVYDEATGHNLSDRFFTYWLVNGNLAQFGHPISEELVEVLENGQPYTVQYFERARFEHHPENAPPYDVLLGQFGRRVVGALNPNTPLPYAVSGGRGILYRSDLGVRVRLMLPTGDEATSDGVVQPFERGAMIWVKNTRRIYVIAKDGLGSQPLGDWQGFADTWEEGQDPGGGPAPVPNLYYPQRGFGKVWREHPEVQRRLGYALTANEQVKQLVLQTFAGGSLIDVRQAPGTNDYRFSPGIYLFYGNGRFEFRYSSGP